MARRRVTETPIEEAEAQSQKRGSAIPSVLQEPDEFSDILEDDPDVRDMNNPDVETLAEPPLLGVRPKPSNLGFGEEAEVFGRATSPKLYASAAQFPTATQFRVWRWENGVPVGLGAIDAEATEEEFVRLFYEAMPRPGQGNFQFRMRPIDIRGQELGKEFTINISEHHATLKHIREAKRREQEEGGSGMERMDRSGWRNGPGPATAGGDIIVNGGTSDAGATYAEEMGRMFEQAVETADQQNKVLRESLEMERERLREEEKTRAEERVSMAERSAHTVEKMMERLMQSDRNRSDEAMKAQQQHSGFMLNTLTQVFTQQQEAARQQAERLREQDSSRMQQDREFYERQRMEMESKRVREREEIEAKRRTEKEEWEHRRMQERDELERRRKQENEDWERKRTEERERLSLEQRRWEEARRNEMEAIRLEAQRREADADRRREQEREEARLRLEEAERKRLMDKEEAKLRLEREKMELEERREQLRQEREQLRLEMEERRQREQQEFERKLAMEREERERRERADRERWERERADADRKREDERREWERRETARREEDERRRLEIEARREADRQELARQENIRRDVMTREAQEAERRREDDRREYERRENLRREELSREMERRKEEMALQMKQMEMQAEKDRQHAERMMEMARMERESQREAQLQREKMEREAREQAEKDRQRQHELQVKEMEMSKERDREHAERMLQLSKIEKSGGLSGITDMLGMDTPEILSKIFGGGNGGGDAEGGGWAETIPKVLGAVAEVAAKTMAAKAGAGAPPPEVMRQIQQPVQPQVQMAQQPRMIAVQTPEGIRMVPAEALARLQAAAAAQQAVAQQPLGEAQPVATEDDDENFQSELPTKGFIPPDQQGEPAATPPAGATTKPEVKEAEVENVPTEYSMASQINPVKRAKEANIPFSDQRLARRAVRDLMAKLEKATEEEWIGVVTEAIMRQPKIYDYLKAVTVWVALVEAQVDPKLALKTVQEMKKSGLIPDDVPYNEADFERLKESK